MDKRKICICIVSIFLCVFYMGCGREKPDAVFEMEGDGADTVSAPEGEPVQMDREALRAMLEEVLEKAVTDQVIQVTCGCTGEVWQTAVGDGAAVVPVDDGKVDINTADAAALQSLNGIGEARAQAIISYRESVGLFQSIEDIKQVDGIGDGIFGKIKDEISVG